MGARHLYQTMDLIKKQSVDVQDIAKRVVQTNAYFAHPENLLCAMLTDSNPDIGRKAVEIVISVRSSSAKKPKSKVARGIRFFRPPTLN